MAGRSLEHLELISIAEKDEQYYKIWIDNNIQEIAQSCLGIRKWMQYRNAITFLSRFCYFSLSSLLNDSTPGEEYCDASVDVKSYYKKLILILLNNELRLPPEIPKYYIKIVKELHLITFFLFGDFYELPKRLLIYNYMTLDSNTYQSRKMNYLYRLIGCFSIIKLIVTIKETKSQELSELDNSFSYRNELGLKFKTNDPNMTCQLCSDTRSEPTSTICGHIFCWYCIHQWLRERLECPICRTPTEPSRLIHLINFK